MLVMMVLLVPLASPAANPPKGAIASDMPGKANHERVSPTPQTKCGNASRARFARPGLVEAYSVSVDGVRRNFNGLGAGADGTLVLAEVSTGGGRPAGGGGDSKSAGAVPGPVKAGAGMLGVGRSAAQTHGQPHLIIR